MILTGMIQSRLSLLAALLFGLALTPAITVAQSAGDNSTAESINIGLLITEPSALAAKHGAELAVREANSRGGYLGKPFRLVVRSTEGPWGTGSKESVSLVFDDDVVAIIGSLDGRNTHLLEQVAAKTRIAVISAWATEMTLSQAFVPWFFRCVPDDVQQATVLLREICEKRAITRIAVIGTEDYDSKNAVRSFSETATLMKLPDPGKYLVNPRSVDLQKTLQEIAGYHPGALVLLGNTSTAADIIRSIKMVNMNLPVFGNFSVLSDQQPSSPDWDFFEGINLVSSGHWFTDPGTTFEKAFRETYGYHPGAAAAYAYDGISLVINAIRSGGTARDRIIESLKNMQGMKGITGEILFDAHGNRTDLPVMMTIRNAQPQIIR
jgi:branched-chain amino acid transport system substrate-binding protein